MTALLTKIKIRPTFIGPMTQSGALQDLMNISGIIFRNAGDNTVQINNGRYTLDSKETLSLNVTEDFATMDVVSWNINFDADGPTNTSKLQIIILKAGPMPPC
jgi:hypothetical protein